MIKEVRYKEQLMGLIIYNSFSKSGVEFFTPPDFSQQVAYMHHLPGKIIEPHVHNPLTREVVLTQEVLIIKRGKLRVDFYSQEREYLESHVLGAGDVVLLASGGHGFEVLEELEMIEVKQGPYSGENDKSRFPATPRKS
jgi:mannose-6-phosphate isomerase-like protein (cupin superfamily)